MAKIGTPGPERENVHLLHFDTPIPSADVIRDELVQRGWDTLQHSLPFDEVPPTSTVLIIDEMDRPVLSALADKQFVALRGLLEQQCRVVWVTKGLVPTSTYLWFVQLAENT
jgi:hypothetical protein